MVAAKTSRGLRVLPSSQPADDVTAETKKLTNEIAQIEQWWRAPRWKGTKRTYSSTDVASLRPSAAARPNGAMSPKCSFSNASSQKLYSLLTSLHAVGGYSHTFGALDPVQVVQMAPHLSSIYISGWQCSSTASSTNEPGPDFADYPMDTVPKKCKLFFSSDSGSCASCLSINPTHPNLIPFSYLYLQVTNFSVHNSIMIADKMRSACLQS